ncbi:hypothetical protein Q4610_06775 [Sphingobium sp. HBC34]|uniref:Uncharacterized protein n=1 Tax=Sphingobium cyanobacteriorum TaxID=3063954 RepID=A0ABT8ZML5_9SPHN|nr:hypothetical protein [Sphingobium sp. HBC34]MDO7834746.1 hypothetical protein [Sphingobium sp. HBC34]
MIHQSSGDEPPYSMRRLSLVPRPPAGYATSLRDWLTLFQALMAIHFASAKEDLPDSARTTHQQQKMK